MDNTSGFGLLDGSPVNAEVLSANIPFQSSSQNVLSIWKEPVAYLKNLKSSLSLKHAAAMLGVGVAAAIVYTQVYAKNKSDPESGTTPPTTDEQTEIVAERTSTSNVIQSKPSNMVQSPSTEFAINGDLIETQAPFISSSSNLSIEVASRNENKIPLPAVEVFTVSRGYHTPGISPFPLELETVLRVGNIQYAVHEPTSSVKYSHGAIPEEENHLYVRVNGQRLATTKNEGEEELVANMCSLLGIDLDAHLTESSESQRRQCNRIKKLLKGRLAWGIAFWRWVIDERRSLPRIAPITFGDFNHFRSIPVIVEAHGYMAGFWKRIQSVSDLIDVVLKTLMELSELLGDKPFFSGSKPGTIDCTAFALISQIIWNLPGSPYAKKIHFIDNGNLVEFVVRMKEAYWPDWKELLQQPDTMRELQLFGPKRKQSTYAMNQDSTLAISHAYADLELADLTDVIIPYEMNSDLLLEFLRQANEKHKAIIRKEREEAESVKRHQGNHNQGHEQQGQQPQQSSEIRPAATTPATTATHNQDFEFDKKRFVKLVNKLRSKRTLTEEEEEFWNFALKLEREKNRLRNKMEVNSETDIVMTQAESPLLQPENDSEPKVTCTTS